ncbi:helicase HerA-like domain-containing protein, partial [uncultured Sulfitobacter sp.]|uniref:helicase HerA-like domain-containing protein n=1 Tax=uncultured Sulfitobacter sp. TaxID=191468 RepID=UPI0025978948
LAAEPSRDNPRFDIEAAIREVGVGEAVTSLLENKGVPGMAERTLIRPPSSRLGPIDAATRAQVMAASPVAGKYEHAQDRQSAYEILAQRAEAAATAAEAAERREEEAEVAEREYRAGRRYSGTRVPRSTARRQYSPGARIGEAMTQAVIKELKGTTGRRIVRGILGGLFKGR